MSAQSSTGQKERLGESLLDLFGVSMEGGLKFKKHGEWSSLSQHVKKTWASRPLQRKAFD